MQLAWNVVRFSRVRIGRPNHFSAWRNGENYANSADDLYIGSAPDYTLTTPNVSGSYKTERLFAGEVAQVAVSGTALTAAQVQTLYYAANLPPSISKQPAAWTVIATIETGTISAVASGTPTLSYRWEQNGAPVSGGSFSGANTGTLTIANASAADNGTYTLVITNLYGAVTSAPSVVTVSSAPFITEQPSPASNSVYAGNDVSFSVSVVGATPLTHQWYNGTNIINGATTSNLVTAVPTGSNNVSVKISNADGTTTSTSGSLSSAPTVTGPWTAVTGSSPLTVTISGSQQFYRVQ